MKICICTNTRPHIGGVTTYVNTLAKYFNLNGHKTVIVSPFGITRQIKVKPRLVKKVDKITSNQKSLTFIILIVIQILTLIHLTLAFLKNRYRLIIAQDPLSANAGLILKKLFNLTVILAVHDTLEKSLLRQNKISENDFTHKYVRRLEKKTASRCDGIYTVSQYVLDFLKKEGVITKEKPTTVINPPVDNQIFFFDQSAREKQRKKLKITPDKFVILFAGQMSDIKGAIYPLHVLKTINEVEANFLLLYVGDGPEKEKIINQIKKFELEKQTILLGKVPPQVLRELYNAADVLVIPSVTVQDKQDTHPLVSIEAMSCRLPIVAFASGGLKEIIIDQQTGILVGEKDYKKMAEAILKIKADSNFRKNIIENAFHHAQNYLPEKIIKKIIEFADNLS